MIRTARRNGNSGEVHQKASYLPQRVSRAVVVVTGLLRWAQIRRLSLPTTLSLRLLLLLSELHRKISFSLNENGLRHESRLLSELSWLVTLTAITRKALCFTVQLWLTIC